MILICPSCQTRYYSSEAALGASGRNVRCASCQHSWFAKPSQTLDSNSTLKEESGLTREQVERLRQKAVENVKTGSGPHAELREKQAKRQKRLRYAAAVGAWISCGVIFTGAATATVNMRQSVVEAWPKSASVYSMMGMPVNRFGLEFGQMETRRSFNGTTPVLTISGEVLNISDKHRPSPVVKLELKNDNGVTVLSEYVGLLDSVVAPSDGSAYTAHIVSPPLDSFEVHVSFESPKDVPVTAHEENNSADSGHHDTSHDDGHDDHADDGHHDDATHDSHAAQDDHHGSEDDHH